MRSSRTIIICLCLMGLAGCKCPKSQSAGEPEFSVDRLYEKGPLSVRLRVDKDKLTIAQTLTLQWEAALKDGYELKMPAIGEVLENFGIVDWQSLPDRIDDAERIVSARNYRLEPFLSGKYSLPALKFEFYDSNDPGLIHELSTEPLDVEVSSLLGEDRSKLEIADIEPVVELPGGGFSPWFPVGLGAATVMLAVAYAIYRRRTSKRGPSGVFLPAHELAYERLRKLVGENLLEQGRIKQFYDRLSDILRYYIEDRFGLRAPERTTEEFLHEIKTTDVPGLSGKDELGEFLRHCDLVKFAEMLPGEDQVQSAFDVVKDFVGRTALDQNKVEVGEAAGAVGAHTGV